MKPVRIVRGAVPRGETKGAGTGNEAAPLLSVLLVSYNSRQYLADCLGSLRAHVSVPFEVVLVDNASLDGSAAFVREQFPWVRLVESTANLGFTGGNNRAAREARGRFLLLLNCDTVLMTDVAPALRILEEEPEVGVVGARMFGGAGEPRPSTGHFPSAWRLWLFKWQWSEPFARPFASPELEAFAHDWVEGSFLLTTRANWDAVGGMDESGFMYGEDVEFCTHTRERGLQTVQCAAVSYRHFGGYNEDRMPFLYAGYRRVHASSRKFGHPWRAETVLLLGLVPRLAVYGLLAAVTRRPDLRNKTRRFWEVLQRWRELAPKPSTRLPMAEANGLRTHRVAEAASR